jgi:hypothetical protein
MDRSRQLEQPAARTPDPARRRPAVDDRSAVLALQRAAGNRAVASVLTRGQRPPGLQRLVVRVDDPSDLDKSRASEFVKTAEVDRMAEYLLATHGGGQVINLQSASAKVEITPGVHWFAGHGSGDDFAGMHVPQFLSKVSFSQLKAGDSATLHLISCNLGNIREPAIFAKELRRTLQADPALTGRTIIIQAAPSFVVHTAGVRGSFAAKDTPEVDALHEALEEDEDRIDTEEGRQLWSDLSALLLDEGATKTPPTKKSLGMYLSGMSSLAAKAAAQAVQQVPGNANDYRPRVVAALKIFADAEPATLLRTARQLAALIEKASPKAKAMTIAEVALARVRDRSRQLWLAYEAEVAKHTGTASPLTLTATDPQRATIKGNLKAKDRPTMASYGWIQYSTKGRYKERTDD